MLETVREFALERLEASGEAGAVRERHARLLFPLIDVGDDARDTAWLDAVEREHENLRAAMRWCMAQGGEALAERGLRLAAAISRVWTRRGQARVGQAELTWALAWPEPAAPGPDYCWARATVLTKAGLLAHTGGDFAATRRYMEASLDLRRRTGQWEMLAFSECSLGLLAFDQGDFEAARHHYAASLALWQERQRRYRCASLDGLGRIATETGDDAAAQAYFAESLDVARSSGMLADVAAILDDIGRLAWCRHDLTAARGHHEAALSMSRDAGGPAAPGHRPRPPRPGRPRRRRPGRGGPLPRGGPGGGLGGRPPAAGGLVPGGPGGAPATPAPGPGSAPCACSGRRPRCGRRWARRRRPASVPATSGTWAPCAPPCPPRTSAPPGRRGGRRPSRRPSPWPWPAEPGAPGAATGAPAGAIVAGDDGACGRRGRGGWQGFPRHKDRVRR